MTDTENTTAKVKKKAPTGDYFWMYAGWFVVRMIELAITREPFINAGLLSHMAMTLGYAVWTFLIMFIWGRKAGWIAFAVLAPIMIAVPALQLFNSSHAGLG
jgi:hypothetical protein